MNQEQKKTELQEAYLKRDLNKQPAITAKKKKAGSEQKSDPFGWVDTSFQVLAQYISGQELYNPEAPPLLTDEYGRKSISFFHEGKVMICRLDHLLQEEVTDEARSLAVEIITTFKKGS